jgi:hypothetical protein
MSQTGTAYLAAQYERKEEMRKCRDDLWAINVKVTSTWIDNNDQGEGLGADDLDKIPHMGIAPALLDTADIARADAFIMFTNGLGRGGHHTELGIALAMNKVIFLIGKRENVFHCLSAIQAFPDWETFMVWSQER